ncbi:MAG: hypothetical protein KAT16_02865 [Candidatus Heimdallarchaeota archaeon]|nr:hypothetical protein [Candidatus Heimdallarchaeota archaeon]
MQEILNSPESGASNGNKKENSHDVLNVREILLLNKKSGLPVFSRVYSRTTGQDPALIAGLMAAIVQFGEMIGNNMELNDIGVQKGSRIFVRSQENLVCLLTIKHFPISYLTSSLKFLEIIDSLSSRIFETIQMLTSLPAYDSGGLIEEIRLSDNTIEDKKSSIFPQLGQIVDNIVMETITMYTTDESEIEKYLSVMEEADSTYLGSEYLGTTRELKTTKLSNFDKTMRNFRNILKNNLED